MSLRQKIAWEALIAAVVAASGAALWVASSVAEAKVAPVSERVARVETQQEAKAGSLYYLRLRQQDGNKAWSSPFWVE